MVTTQHLYNIYNVGRTDIYTTNNNELYFHPVDPGDGPDITL